MGDSIFHHPYDAMTPAQLLDYFRQRDHVCAFSVLDEEETRPEKMDALLDNCFEFNNERYHLPQGFDWTANPSQDIEWLIFLHKFYYAPGLGARYQATGDERYAAKWLELTNAWIDTVPLPFLTSDVLGRRVQNWIFAYRYFVNLTGTPLLSPAFHLKFITSLHDQVSHLRHNLTPARNHRTLELSAIFWAAAVFPELRPAAEWLDFARRELLANMQTDLLPDGVQCELSTDYHHIVLKNYLGVRRLAAMNGIPMPPAMDDLLQRALEFALYAHKPDGYIPALSDGDTGSFLAFLQQGYELYGLEELRYGATQGREGRPPAQRSRAFRDSGYVVLRSGWGEGAEPYADERYLIFDCGPLGAGNHGHLDLLSFEMAAFGRSLIVDPGRYTYDESGDTNWRAIFRGTGYHNTMQVDKKNQTRYQFHKNRYRILGPEPEYRLEAFVTAPDYDYVHGSARSHEYPVLHERQIFFAWLEYWIITDRLRAGESHDYDLLFHLSPAAKQPDVEMNAATRLVHAPHLVIAQPADDQTRLSVENGFVSPVYGLKQAAPILRFSRHAASTTFYTILYPYRGLTPELAVTVLPVTRDGHVCADSEAYALSITIGTGGQQVTDTYFNRAASAPDGCYAFGPFACDGVDSLLLCIRQDAEGRILSVQGMPGAVKVLAKAGREQVKR